MVTGAHVAAYTSMTYPAVPAPDHARFSSSVSTNWPRSSVAMARISSSVSAKSNTSRFSLRRRSLRDSGMGVMPRCRSHRRMTAATDFFCAAAMPRSTGSSSSPMTPLPSGLYASNRMPSDLTSRSRSARWLYGCTSTWSTAGRTLAYPSSSFRCRLPKFDTPICCTTPSCCNRSRASQVFLLNFEYCAIAPGSSFRTNGQGQ
mmetsp:Transcript_16484/g.25168  ORF Transcript_16484/g.25168 Transcript_16484/m.25168 type:complete len:203 (-) Transcript_16484:293-901(-)